MLSLAHAHSAPRPFLMSSPCCEYSLYFLIQILPILHVSAKLSSPPQNFLYVFLEKMIALHYPYTVEPLIGASILRVASWLQHGCRSASLPNQVPGKKEKCKGQEEHLSQLRQPHVKSSPRSPIQWLPLGWSLSSPLGGRESFLDRHI